MSQEDLGQRLFRAARSERPRDDLGPRILARADKESREPTASPPAPARWLVAGSLAAAAALAAGTLLFLQSPPSEIPAIARERFVPVPPHEPEVARAPEPVEVAPTAPTGSSVEAPSSERAAPAPSRPVPRTLPEQLSLLKQARSALRSGKASRSLEILEEYEGRPNRVDMSAEATLLRIETLASLGQPARAAALAKQFVRAHPSSPLADRARSFTNDDKAELGALPSEDGESREGAPRDETSVRSEDGQRQAPDGRVSDEDNEE